MASDNGKKAVEDYFGAPANQAMLDQAALIVALVAGRESATRTDYAHPRLKDIVKILEGIATQSGPKR